MLVLHLLDPYEIRLPLEGHTLLQDMESGQQLEADRSVASNYRLRVERWRAWLGRECRRHSIDYQPLDTDTPFEQALLGYLYKRERLG